MRLKLLLKGDVNNSVEKESSSKQESLVDKSYFCGR